MNPHQFPAHFWLFLMFLVLLVGYYIRPDPVTVDLLKADFGALLVALNLNPKPPNP